MTITFVCRATKVSKKDGLTPLELYRPETVQPQETDYTRGRPDQRVHRGDKDEVLFFGNGNVEARPPPHC